MDNSLNADRLRDDPRVAEARRLLQEAVQEHRGALAGIAPPCKQLRHDYEKLLSQAGQVRGHALWYPYIGSGLGNGALVELADGSVKYDFTAGIGVHFGHSIPQLTDAAFDAALDNIIQQGNLQQNREAVTLMTRLTELAGLDHCFLSTSGVMAGENALKLAFQARAPRNRILAFSNCFMGRTLAISQITDRPHYRQGLPLNMPVDYVPFFDYRDPVGSRQCAVDHLGYYLERYPDQHVAMVLELVQGEGGYYPGDREFFVAILETLREVGIITIIDEVQTFARTERLFAFQYFELDPLVDVVMIGKLAQVCATLWRKQFNPDPLLLSQTFISSTAAIHASHTILDAMLEGEYFGPEGRHAHLRQLCLERLQQIPGVHGPFGLGMMIGFTPFDGERERVLDLALRLFEAGIIVMVCGNNPTRLRFLLPAGGVTTEDIEQGIQIVAATMEENAW